MHAKNKLAIFDLDGTLFDTKNVNYAAYKEAVKICGYDIKLDYHFYCDFCNGNSFRTFLPRLIPGLPEEMICRIHNIKKTVYASYLELAVKNDIVFSIIKLLRPQYLTAIVTTASRKNTDEILSCFSVKEYFDLIITQEDVKEVKPSPEGFLLAMQRFGIAKENTIIFEDSDVGLKAAKDSGAKYMKVYGYN